MASKLKKKIYSFFHGFKFQRKWENYMVVFVHPLMPVSKMCRDLSSTEATTMGCVAIQVPNTTFYSTPSFPHTISKLT